MNRWRAALLATVVGGCGQSGVERGDRPILGGEPTSEFPAVGYLASSGQGCTAALVGERTIVTARHCIGDVGVDGFEPDDVAKISFTVTADIHVDAGAIGIQAEAVIAHPVEGDEFYSDIALVRLVTAPDPEVPRILLAIAAPEVGQPITLVGFGQNETAVSGVKRRAETTIAELTPLWVQYEGNKNICFGDSGGPSLATRGDQLVVVGVHSFVFGGCPVDQQIGVDMRADAFVDWLVEAGEGDVLVEGGMEGTPDAGTSDAGASDAGTADAGPGVPDARPGRPDAR